MTRGEFDSDMNGRESWGDGCGPEDGFEVLPPEVLEAGVEMPKQVEQAFDEPRPGDLDPQEKITDPDEWHH